jgi:CO/xanthine dehydrogenase FAD-binding subunit
VITRLFDYVRPEGIADVVGALVRGEDPVVLGGGTMLVPDMTHGRTRPGMVVDLVAAGLSYVELRDDGVAIGAMTTYAELLDHPRAVVPALLRAVAAGVTGGPQIRNRGTIGGSASYANPSSEVLAALVAHEAVMRLSSSRGDRDVPAHEFALDAFRTVRRPDEVLREVVIPRLLEGSRTGYVKLKLAEGSWPIATAAAVALHDRPVRVALGGVAATPLQLEVDRPPTSGSEVMWRSHVREHVGRVLTEPWSDVLADAAYRSDVAPVVAVRAVLAACQEGNDD